MWLYRYVDIVKTTTVSDLKTCTFAGLKRSFRTDTRKITCAVSLSGCNIIKDRLLLTVLVRSSSETHDAPVYTFAT